MSADQYPEPVVDPEAEGLPGYADDDSFADPERPSGRSSDGPRPAALPADHPIAVTDFGTTAQEQRDGEPLADRLRREVPDVTADQPLARVDPVAAAETEWESGRLDPFGELETNRDPENGASDMLDDEPPQDALIEMDQDAAQAADALALTGFEPLDPRIDSPVSVYDRDLDGVVGRLVGPDEGAHTDVEKDEIAADFGVSGGGPTAEEAAMHEVGELR